jgi:type I site-specific restriction-modification system R (restriction) subunit
MAFSGRTDRSKLRNRVLHPLPDASLLEKYEVENAITTAEGLQKLIDLAKDIRAARQHGEESGLSDQEIAFHDALAENETRYR